MVANYISNTPEGKDFFEGKSQHLVANAIFDTINSCSKLPHIIGLEGDWGSGKSNIIKQLSSLGNFDKNYYLFTYDAWGHQEDLQRRSILEVLTTELIKKEYLVGKGTVRLRNGEVKEDEWSSLLSYLLSNKTVTTTKPSVKASSFTLVMLAIVCIANVTSTISSDKYADDNSYAYWIFLLAPYVIGLLLIGAFALGSCSWNFLKQWVTKEDAEKVTEEYVSSEEPSIQEFRNWMQAISDYIGCSHKPELILVFDNMDRLAPEKVKQLWSSIYAFFAGEAFENIWVIIPYDEKHLVSAFSEGDEKKGDNFIKKTFSMVYRVSPPVISDYELLFHSYFDEAFGKHEDENRINQIFRVLNPNPNPRDVIYFLNQMVSLVRMWGDKIPLADIALYVCRKVSHHRGDKTLDEYLLSNDVFENVKALFVHQEDTKVNLTKIAYGLTDDEMARQIPMRNYLRAYFEDDGNRDINEFADKFHFVTVLTNVINDAPQTLINKYIIGLGTLDSSKLSDEDKNNIKHKWDCLANKWKENDIDKQTFGEEPKLLLLHCSDKYDKHRFVSNVVEKLKNYFEFNGKDYYVAMNELRQFVIANSIEYDFSTIEWVTTSAEQFWSYLHAAKDEYLDFHVFTSNKELMAYLSDSNLKTCKWQGLVEYLVNDQRYDFIPLLDFCLHLIKSEEIDKDNICTLLYFESFIYSQIKKQIVLKNNLPKADVLSNLYSEVYANEECVRKTGYWDFVFLSMILAAETPDVAEENLDSLASVSVKYDCFNDVFVNLGNVYAVRKKLAQRIIELNLKGNLDVVTKINVLPSIQAATALPWEILLNYFSKYVDELSEEDKNGVKEDFVNIVPSSLFSYLKVSDSGIVKWIVSEGRECLESGEHALFNSNGAVINGYWKDFVASFLSSNSWKNTDGFVLEELRKVFRIYCDNHDFSLVNNDFVDFLLDNTHPSDAALIMYQVRNGFTVGNKEADIEEFKWFAGYFTELKGTIPNKDTFVQNFIEYAFTHDEICRALVQEYSKFYMPLLNECHQIAKGIIDFIVAHKDSEDTCQKLYEYLSEEIKNH